MAASIERLAAISDQHTKQHDSIVLKLIKLLLGVWGDFGSSRDPDAVLAMASQSATLVGSAVAQTRRLTRSYLQATLREMDALPSKLPPIMDAYPRSGVSALDAYSRPANQFIYALSQGSTVEEARTVGVERLQQLAGQDVYLADRDEQQRVYKAAPKVIGYRRVIHPELSKTGTCGLCVVAADRLYHLEELLPIHAVDEHCTTMPVTKGDDPGFRLNGDDLQKIYAAAGSTFAEDLLNTRITINEHGEMGPVLVKQGDHFRTAKEAGRPEYVKPTPDAMRKANRTAQTQAQSELDDVTRRLNAMTNEVSTDRSVNAERATLTQASKNLKAYIASLDSAFKSLE